jgi:hypothetical protein
LVWNPGERVEGYSNFLDVVLIAALGWIGVDLKTASRVVSIGAYLGIVPLLILYAAPDWRRARRGRATVPLIVTMTSCPMIIWALGGLESTLCAFLALAGVMVVAGELSNPRIERLAAAGALFALATMTRIDAVLFVPPAVGYLALRSEGKRGLRGAGVVAVVFSVVYVPYFVWRTHYYGQFLPNTFYAKGMGHDWHSLFAGIQYVAGIVVRPPALALWIAAAGVVVWRQRAMTPRLSYLAATALSYLVFPVLAGGDWMPAGRFLVPVLPVLSLVLYEAMRSAKWGETPRQALGLGAALLAGASLQFAFARLNPVHSDGSAYIGEVVGEYAERHWPAGSTVSLNAAGAVPYYAHDLRFIDMLGLNDLHIAHVPTSTVDLPRTKYPGHRKGDGAYVLARDPDFIILGPPEGTATE